VLYQWTLNSSSDPKFYYKRYNFICMRRRD
jgi:hypothetical protein